MMLRARKLKDAITLYSERHPEDDIEDFTDEQWEHVNYLIQILYPFAVYTDAIGRTAHGPTVHDVFSVYNFLFAHMEKHISILRRKRVFWKVKIRQALENGHAKLSHYYSKTKTNIGYIYAVATILAPHYKLAAFETEDWEGGDQAWVCMPRVNTLIITKLILLAGCVLRETLHTLPGV
jgi:hypothetical protein